MTEKELQKDLKERERNSLFIRPQIGLNSHKRYFASFLLIILFYEIIGQALQGFIIATIADMNPEMVNVEEFRFKDSLLNLFLSFIDNIFLVVTIWIVARKIHKRSLISFITPNPKINWKRVFFGFTVFFLLMSISQIIDMILHPDSYQWNNFDASRFVWLLVATIFFIPIQTTSEELLYRGFLLQWIGKLVKQPILLSLIVGFLFGAVHFGNPEMVHGAFWTGLYYVFTGFMLSYIAIRTNSSELSIGFHAANNMFLCIFLSDKNSVHNNLPALFVVNNTDVDAMSSTICSIILISIFYLISIYYHKKQNQK